MPDGIALDHSSAAAKLYDQANENLKLPQIKTKIAV
jgi:hypothetical protein